MSPVFGPWALTFRAPSGILEKTTGQELQNCGLALVGALLSTNTGGLKSIAHYHHFGETKFILNSKDLWYSTSNCIFNIL